MTKQIFSDRAAAEAEATRLNNARTRDNVEYVAAPQYDWSAGGKVVGFYVGVCSND